MTNAEKYEEVFGFPPVKHNCITIKNCCECPLNNERKNRCLLGDRIDWWDSEYKGVTNG